MDQINDIIELIQSKVTDQSYTANEYNTMIEQIYSSINEEYPHIPYTLVRDIASRMAQCHYQFGTNCEMNFRQWDKLLKIDEINYKDIVIPKKHIKNYKHFVELYDTPQPEQRTKEWFDYRYNRITASDMATAIDANPYESVEGFICKKCDPNFPFLDNDFVFHGKKYEQIATSLYEHLFNTKVTEFGCLPSNRHLFLGASPDGICSKSTLDYRFNPKLGTMLEIKCPYVREIKNKGEIAGEICPYYYYCQVQQQLECCDLENCDFIQCALQEYKNRDEYLRDTSHVFDVSEGVEGTHMNVCNTMSKGYLLQFLPKKFEPQYEGDKHNYKGFFIYPPRLTMSPSQYDEWVLNTLGTWQTEYPDIADTYYFDRILYWKINNAHTVTIPRDKEWFANIFPILKKTWETVVYYREHLEELPLLQTISDKRKKFYKMNTQITVNNFEPNTAFLNSTSPVKEVKIFKKSKYYNKSSAFKQSTKIYSKKTDECEFVDD